jgi:uncharacterized integral membrane protein
MSYKFKKLINTLLFNSSIFFMLMIGIQNSWKNSNVKFFTIKTVNLPISFIIGTSFISGSLIGSFLNLNFETNDKENA